MTNGRHRGDSRGDGNSLSRGDRCRRDVSWWICCRRENIRRGRKRRECRRRFSAGDSGGDRRGDASLTFKLAVAGPKETVTVSEAPPTVETQSECGFGAGG